MHFVQYSVIASSSCGWKTLIKKSSRNEVSVLMAMFELIGTISLRRCRNDNVGGSRRFILKTLGSTTSLWPAAALSEPAWHVSRLMPVVPRDFETRPGTDDFKMSSKSSCSFFIADDLLSISVNLNIFLCLSRGFRPKTLPLSEVERVERRVRSPSLQR